MALSANGVAREVNVDYLGQQHKLAYGDILEFLSTNKRYIMNAKTILIGVQEAFNFINGKPARSQVEDDLLTLIMELQRHDLPHIAGDMANAVQRTAYDMGKPRLKWNIKVGTNGQVRRQSHGNYPLC